MICARWSEARLTLTGGRHARRQIGVETVRRRESTRPVTDRGWHKGTKTMSPRTGNKSAMDTGMHDATNGCLIQAGALAMVQPQRDETPQE